MRRLNAMMLLGCAASLVLVAQVAQMGEEAKSQKAKDVIAQQQKIIEIQKQEITKLKARVAELEVELNACRKGRR